MKKYRSAWPTAAVWGFLSLVPLQDLFSQGGSSHSTKLTGKEARRFNALSEELICQCGCNLVLGQCGHINCPSAIPMRNTIEAMILEGQSDQEVLNYFMNEYRFRDNPPVGKAILSQPATEGFDLVAWIMPFVLFAGFAVVTVYMVLRFSRRTGTPSPVSAAPLAEDDYQKRIEDELKRTE